MGEMATTLTKIFPEFPCEIGPGLWPSETYRALVRGPLEIGKARSELGYSPQYDLEKGIQDFVQYLGTCPEHKSWTQSDLF